MARDAVQSQNADYKGFRLGCEGRSTHVRYDRHQSLKIGLVPALDVHAIEDLPTPGAIRRAQETELVSRIIGKRTPGVQSVLGLCVGDCRFELHRSPYRTAAPYDHSD
jgi:hypothetical protein